MGINIEKPLENHWGNIRKPLETIKQPWEKHPKTIGKNIGQP